MLKLEDFKIKEIETLDTIKGGEMGRPRQCAEMTHSYVNFLGWIVKTKSVGDIHDD
ncbi:hypothetical protein [Tenacibaculum litopenaei]|uniref:hypothetical protein n=1 Tax=Tenacibaculum litopenaei TaxID=396016 RepID=UPI0038B6A61F